LWPETVDVLTGYYEPTLKHFLAPAIVDELIRVREELLLPSMGSVQPVDADQARTHVAQRLDSLVPRAAEQVARKVLTPWLADRWESIARGHALDFGPREGQAFLAQMEHSGAAFCAPEKVLLRDSFLQQTGALFTQAVGDLAREIAQDVRSQEGSLERVETILGLRPDTSEQPPATDLQPLSGPVT
jgi:hypothetical protein